MSRIALIDGDEVAYKIALKYQTKYYTAMKGDKILWKEKYKEDIIESIQDRDDIEIGEYIEQHPLGGIKDDIDTAISSILYNSESMEYRIFLSDKKNFRDELATLQPYKGNRDFTKRPICLEEIRDELRYRKAETYEWLEADDMMSAYCTILGRDNTIICSSDKDLRTVPSFNYNINKKVIDFISKEEAKRNFYFQLMIGDPVDNIPSPYGLGEVMANKILDKLELNNIENYYIAIKPLYLDILSNKSKDGKYKTKWYLSQDIDSILLEVGNLLWMHRTLDPTERWSPLL